MAKREQQFTAIYRKTGKWFIGWIEEIPGVNTQGKTLKEVKENMKEALELMLECNRELARREAGKGAVREKVTVSV